MAQKSSIQGINETIAIFRKVDAKVCKKAIRFAIVRAAATVRKAVRDRVPTVTGALRRAIGTKTKNRKTSTAAIVGVRTRFQDKKSGKIPNFYASHVEFGDDQNAPKSFIRDGAKSVQDEVPKIYANEIRKALMEFIKR